MAAAALWVSVVLTSYFAVRYLQRDTALLRLLADERRLGKPSVGELLVVVPLLAMACVLQGILLVGAITLELPINRMIACIELATAAGWIGYLISRPRATPPDHSDGPT